MRGVVDRSLPADPDVDVVPVAHRVDPRRAPLSVLAAIAAGGALGSLARYALTLALPGSPEGFPWATFLANVAGCLAIGALTVPLAGVWAGRRLLRPFLAVGVLGGFTTFSAYAVDVHRLLESGATGTALLYLAGTLVAGLLAAYAGMAAARALINRLTGPRRGTPTRPPTGARRAR